MFSSLLFRDEAVASVVGSWYTGSLSDAVNEWMDAYRRAWESNDPAHIRALFSEEAVYYTEPFEPPAIGHNQIIEMWLGKKDAPGETTFTWKSLVQTEAVTVVQGETVYRDGPTYSNLWVIRFDESGKATEFTEWWMDQAHPAS